MTKKSKTRLHNERNCDQLRGDIVDKKFGREKKIILISSEETLLIRSLAKKNNDCNQLGGDMVDKKFGREK